ncbi:MAG: alpha-1,4-glucan--maltose-1-phosphate maltosyltransferase [Chitinophagales bacterium]
MQGQIRVYIDHVYPEIDGGRFYIKRVEGEVVNVEADVFTDGHDLVAASVLFRHESEKKWQSSLMLDMGGHHKAGSFKAEQQGFYYYTIQAWVDHALSWKHNFKRRLEGKEKLDVELLAGVQHLKRIRSLANKNEAEEIDELIRLFKSNKHYDEAIEAATGHKVEKWMLKYPDNKIFTQYPELRCYVDRGKARFSTWYELFPRSASGELIRHGTFKDVEARLPSLHELGIDVLYLPPVHSIGSSFRKGKNNSLKPMDGEPGSPWAIGYNNHGHKSIHPELGSLRDFHSLVKTANELGIEVALDYALQCSPDHPYVKKHPQWFTWRQDGTVQYAENPPKKYQDVVPFNFESDDWENLWKELKSIIDFWIQQGVKIFRVDNPHTKPIYFWEWIIAEVKKKNPEVLFLAEAFTEPGMMYLLAKAGFTQSYTYFTWRNTKQELTEYMDELTSTEVKEFFRPCFWMNTPDILPYHLQTGLEAVFITRFFLAATMSSDYGWYGPVYELLVHEAMPGREEYLNSEKYEIRNWDWSKDNRLKMLMTIVNRARKENPALQETCNIRFLHIQNDNLIAYYKQSSDGKNKMICIVNLDPHKKQWGMLHTPLEQIGKTEGEIFIVHDLLNDARYEWSRKWNYVELDPAILPCHLFRIEEA